MNPPDKPNLPDLRISYEIGSLDEADAPSDPLELFRRWIEDALEHQLPEPNAMTLATIGLDGMPTSRTVLLKGLDDRGFHFFSNYQSRKGQELAQNPRASITFLWATRQRQVNVRGMVWKLPQQEAETYFSSRPRNHQVGAWASTQSAEIPNRSWLEERAAAVEAEYEPATAIPCPPHWGGYALLPDEIEFWQGRRSRLHDRLRYTRELERWTIQRLAP
ncbi:MAG: pyridoxamine 5'-phosphate oxidase [Verrucomicrobiales bacterium]|nr:pyridoxamine 5'-phosphate oxidase [Verrucomicrobiales bacterium]